MKKTVFVVDASQDRLTNHLVDGQVVVVEVKLNPKTGNATVIAPKAFADQWPTLKNVTLAGGWLDCEGPARFISESEFPAFAWELFVKKAFEIVELPEVEQSQLETGTYTNHQIAEHYRNDPNELLVLLNKLSMNNTAAEKRSILSFAVDQAKTK